MQLPERAEQCLPMIAQPAVGFRQVRPEQIGQQGVKRRRVVKMHAVRGLMRNNRAAHMIGRLYQPPI